MGDSFQIRRKLAGALRTPPRHLCFLGAVAGVMGCSYSRENYREDTDADAPVAAAEPSASGAAPPATPPPAASDAEPVGPPGSLDIPKLKKVRGVDGAGEGRTNTGACASVHHADVNGGRARESSKSPLPAQSPTT